jgi:hypothetical protein
MSVIQLSTAAPAQARDALLSRVEDRLRDLFATETSRWSAVDPRAPVTVEAVAAAPLDPGWRDELARVAVQVAYRQK